ncbi:Plant UBX domain-containing protein 4 [Sesamum alatum]|uniref:Plant UBX domain-containing protein 4 n=1 Tax=Sesamum alatum TaxID=300844 RepID=A0AAE1XZW3_9LAMI|nr:Plant UBX domain-containing protein 4 [Sesamum alatum]
MENQSSELAEEASLNSHPQIALINTFCEITAAASKSEALFFLESHNFDLDAAVSTFLDDANPAAAANPGSPAAQSQSHYSPSESLSPSTSPSRSRSLSPPPASRSYNLRSSAKPSAGPSGSGGRKGGGGGGGGGIRTLSDLNRNPKDEDSDSDPDFDPQEYYTGGEKSGMLVRDPSKANDVDAIFNQARQSGAVEASAEHLLPSSSRSFAGTARLPSGEVSSTPQQPEVVNHNITFWRNGFTVDDGPLRRLDDPENASFLESIRKSECPEELAPANKSTAVHVNLMRKEEDYKEPQRPRRPFQGLGRTLGSTSDVTPLEPNTVSTVLTAAPTPSVGLVVDQTKPCTSIQLRLADGTRMVSRFNNYHTIRDIRGFIDASRPDGPRTYQLQTMGFPPKQLTDLDQTIDEAGIANSVVIQKL